MSTIEPTRKLKATEKKVFDRAVTSFAFLRPEDAELLTSYSEQGHRYAVTKRATDRKPTVTAPIFSRSDGKQIGQRPVRNPAFASMREALTQMRLLERRLTTLNDKRRAGAEREQRRKEKPKPLPSWSSEQARARAAYDLAEKIEAEILAGTFELTEARLEDIGQELLRVGCTLRGDELRTITLSFIESRFWAARHAEPSLEISPAETYVDQALEALGFYSGLFVALLNPAAS
ncbi:MAG: hypothetical protein WBW84_19470 [Acidobacteriaceae bacterium]